MNKYKFTSIIQYIYINEIDEMVSMYMYMCSFKAPFSNCIRNIRRLPHIILFMVHWKDSGNDYMYTYMYPCH